MGLSGEKMQFCVCCFASFKRLICFWGLLGGWGRLVGWPSGVSWPHGGGGGNDDGAYLRPDQHKTRACRKRPELRPRRRAAAGRNCSTSWVKCKQQYYLLEWVSTARKPVSSVCWVCSSCSCWSQASGLLFYHFRFPWTILYKKHSKPSSYPSQCWNTVLQR